MIFYLSILIALVVARISIGEYSHSNRRIYQYVIWILFIVCAFRLDVGCDWNAYYAHYIDQKAGTFGTALQQREWLWYSFLEVVDQIGLDYVWLNVATSAIFFIGVHAFAKRQPDPLGFLVLLFPILIINLPMSGIRQAAAVGLMCLALVSFMERRLFSFVVWTFIAGSIHSSAILFLFLAPFCLNLRPSVQLLAAVALSIPGLLLMFSGESAEVAFSRYVQTDMDVAGAGYRVSLIVATGMLFLFVVRRSWSHFFSGDYPLMVIGALIMVMCGVLFLVSPVIADRFGYYLIPLQAVILTRLPYLPVRAGRPLFFIGPYALFLGVFVAWIWFSNLFMVCYVPYKVWLFG